MPEWLTCFQQTFDTKVFHLVFSLRMLFLFVKSKNKETRFNEGQQTTAVDYFKSSYKLTTILILLITSIAFLKTQP